VTIATPEMFPSRSFHSSFLDSVTCCGRGLCLHQMLEDFQALSFLVLALVHREEEGQDAEAAQQEGAGPQAQTIAARLHLDLISV